MISTEAIKYLVDLHDQRWEDQKETLYNYRSAYETKFWARKKEGSIFSILPTQMTVETSEAYGYIEAYLASLFSKNPSVVIKPDIRGDGDAQKSEMLVNDWMLRIRSALKLAATRSLIYGSSFVKLIPCEDLDIFKRVEPVVLNPWEVLLDLDATSWDAQRFIGHIYYMPLKEAKDKWGDSEFVAEEKRSFFSMEQKSKVPDDPMFKYIRIVEVYDLEEKNIIFWSPNYEMGDAILDEVPMFIDSINKALPPIIPMYFIKEVDSPLIGYSALSRVYDQIVELNLIRTFQANAVRKASRQWLVKKGALSAESKALIERGDDGQLIDVEDDDMDLAGVILPIPHTATPGETYEYYAAVKADLEKGSVVAPFTRGQATQATATEVTALAAYSSTEIGNLARERDGFIEELAKTYLGMLSYYLEENDERELVVLNGKAQVIKPDDVRAEFKIFAADSASTPISQLASKQEAMSLIPTLAQLGVASPDILKYLVEIFELPENFIPEEAPKPLPSPSPETQAAAPGPVEAGLEGQGSVGRIQGSLPNGMMV